MLMHVNVYIRTSIHSSQLLPPDNFGFRSDTDNKQQTSKQRTTLSQSRNLAKKAFHSTYYHQNHFPTDVVILKLNKISPPFKMYSGSGPVILPEL